MEKSHKEHKEWEEKLKATETQTVSMPIVQWVRYKDGMMVLQMLTATGKYVEVPVHDVDETFKKTQ